MPRSNTEVAPTAPTCVPFPFSHPFPGCPGPSCCSAVSLLRRNTLRGLDGKDNVTTDHSMSLLGPLYLGIPGSLAAAQAGQLSSEATAPAFCCLCSAFAWESAQLQVTPLSEWSSKPKGPCPELAHGVGQRGLAG